MSSLNRSYIGNAPTLRSEAAGLRRWLAVEQVSSTFSDLAKTSVMRSASDTGPVPLLATPSALRSERGVNHGNQASASAGGLLQVKLHGMFLRNGCELPDGLKLKQEPFNKEWTSAENMTSAALDAAVRRVGWHFMWIEIASAGRGLGRTEETAISQAITRALHQSSPRFNAAEVVSITVSKFAGFRVAKVTVRARQIQQEDSLRRPGRPPLRQNPLG